MSGTREAMWAGSHEMETASPQEIYANLGDHELAVIQAFDRADELDEIALASKARLRVSTAFEAARNLHRLGLIEFSTDDDGRTRFRLLRDRVREQIEIAPEALYA